MPLELAEVQAEVLTEAFKVNLENLVTKEYLDSRLEAQSVRLEARMDTKLTDQKAYMDTKFAEIDGRFRSINWTLRILTVGVLIPLIERLATL